MVENGARRTTLPKPNLIVLAVLFLSFSITLLSQQSLGQGPKNIAYAYLVGSAVFVIMAILPQFTTNFMKNKYAIVISYSAANLAWFFTFVLKWLDGIKNTQNVEQAFISWVGFVFLLAIVVIETRYLKELTKIREVGLLMPIAIGIQGVITLTNSFDALTFIIFFLYVAAPVCIVYTKWKPGGDLPYLT